MISYATAQLAVYVPLIIAVVAAGVFSLPLLRRPNRRPFRSAW